MLASKSYYSSKFESKPKNLKLSVKFLAICQNIKAPGKLLGTVGGAGGRVKITGFIF